MHLGVDFDDVLYPYHHYLKKRIATEWGIDLTGERITTYYYEDHPLLKAKGITRKQLWGMVQDAWKVADEHAEAALLDPAAPGVLKQLARQHEITLITARHEEALPLLEIFLKRHAIHPKRIMLGKDDKRGFDILIDDYPKHAKQNAEDGGHSFLYHCDENSGFDDSRHPRIIRVHSWKEIATLVPIIEKRRRADA